MHTLREIDAKCLPIKHKNIFTRDYYVNRKNTGILMTCTEMQAIIFSFAINFENKLTMPMKFLKYTFQ